MKSIIIILYNMALQPRAKMPNSDTMATIEQMEKGEGKVYKDPDGLFKSWEEE